MTAAPAAPELRKADNDVTANLHAFAELFRVAALEMGRVIDDPRDLFAQSMTAAFIFAGIQYGQLVAIGDIPDSDAHLAVMLGAMRHNFEQGIDMGKHRASRRLTEAGFAN